jgi:hypothetical protein
MSGRAFDRRLAAILAGLAVVTLSLPACEPLPTEPDASRGSVRLDGGKDEPIPVDEDTGGGNDGPSYIPSGPYVFAISESDSTPDARLGEPREGFYLLYLWLVSGPGGISALEGNIQVTGDAPFDPVFSAISPNLGVWIEGGSDVLLAIPGEPTGPTLLGSVLIEGSGNGGTVTLVRASGESGAVDCNSLPQVHGFTCLGYSSIPRTEAHRRGPTPGAIVLAQ